VPDEKLHVLRYGPNLPREPKENELRYSKTETLRLLFIGYEWKRKGGNTVIKILNKLKEYNHTVELDIIGSVPPMVNDTNIIVHKKLNKDNEKEFNILCNIFLACDFLLAPTIAECSAAVFREASCFALPIITTDTGGNPDYVLDGTNGYRLPMDAKPEEYAQLIHKIYSDEKRYIDLRVSTREFYEKNLSWNNWLQRFDQIVQQL
jgi:glycosyltransferase involved in cell wall biosynthesis